MKRWKHLSKEQIVVKEGEIWTSVHGVRFRVIAVIEADGKLWVHYRNESADKPEEYSCYLESFITRFSLCVNANC